MRILHIDPDDLDNPLAGGGPRRTFEIYRRMARRHEITVLTPTFEGSTPELVRDGVRYVRLGRKVGDHGSSHHITFFFSLPMAIGRYEHDLLVEDLMPPASATLTPLFNRKPLIASVQWFFSRALARQYHLPFHLIERVGIRFYRDFVVQTRAMAETILAMHPRARCEVIPAGADDDLFHIPIRTGDFVLYLGRVDLEQKGVDLLLAAYALVPPDERVRLVLAGHGFAWDAVRSKIAACALESWVEIRGRVDLEARGRLMSECRFTCVPSREETFGMVILESCAAGKPVVLFDKAPMNEVAAREACELVPAYDVAAYAQAIRRLLRLDPAELARRGAACRAWAGGFRWDAIAERQEAFYERVLNGAAGS